MSTVAQECGGEGACAPDPAATPQTPSIESCFFGSVTVGERGQVVIPAEIRREHGISPGDHLLVFRHPYTVGVILVKLDAMHEAMSQILRLTTRVAGDARDADPTGQEGV